MAAIGGYYSARTQATGAPPDADARSLVDPFTDSIDFMQDFCGDSDPPVGNDPGTGPRPPGPGHRLECDPEGDFAYAGPAAIYQSESEGTFILALDNGLALGQAHQTSSPSTLLVTNQADAYESLALPSDAIAVRVGSVVLTQGLCTATMVTPA